MSFRTHVVNSKSYHQLLCNSYSCVLNNHRNFYSLQMNRYHAWLIIYQHSDKFDKNKTELLKKTKSTPTQVLLISPEFTLTDH